jgi:hypothetical protein
MNEEIRMDSNDKANGLKSLISKFKKIYPDEKIIHYSYSDVYISKKDGKRRSIKSVFFRRGNIIFSNKRIYFKTCFLSIMFFLSMFQVIISLLTAIVSLVMLGVVINHFHPNEICGFSTCLIPFVSVGFFFAGVGVKLYQYLPHTIEIPIETIENMTYERVKRYRSFTQILSLNRNDSEYLIELDSNINGQVMTEILENGYEINDIRWTEQ